MGNAAGQRRRGSDDGPESAEANPFEAIGKKDRFLLYETWQDVVDGKAALASALQNFLSSHPAARPTFGVAMVPPARYLEKPKVGAHLVAVTEFLGRLVQLLGYHENLGGALTLVRSVGKVHGVRVAPLAEGPGAGAGLVEAFAEAQLFALLPRLRKAERRGAAQAPVGQVQYAYQDGHVADVWARLFAITARVLRTAAEAQLSSNRRKQHLSEKTADSDATRMELMLKAAATMEGETERKGSLQGLSQSSSGGSLSHSSSSSDFARRLSITHLGAARR